MTARLNPYLSFTGTAREAMEFYRDALGGELRITTFGEFGEADPAVAGQVMHSQLETAGGLTLMGADTPPGEEHKPGNAVTVSLTGDTGDGLHEAWQKLTEGGTVTVPLEKQMWGDEFGMCTDRFGVQWMVNIAGSSV